MDKCTVCGKPEKYETHGPAGCVIELRRQRDEWARQCNAASEAHADALNRVAALQSEIDRLRSFTSPDFMTPPSVSG